MAPALGRASTQRPHHLFVGVVPLGPLGTRRDPLVFSSPRRGEVQGEGEDVSPYFCWMLQMSSGSYSSDRWFCRIVIEKRLQRSYR